MRLSHFNLMGLILLATASPAVAHAAISGVTYDTIALTNNAAPGTAAGVNFSEFSNPVLNDSGQAAFRAFLAGANVNSTNDAGVFSNASGTLSLVAREGNAAPGTSPSVNFIGMGSPVLNDAGQTAFSAFLTGTGVNSTNNLGVFSEVSSTLGLVTRTGDAAPGTSPGVNFSSFGSLLFNNAGQTAFLGLLAGTGVVNTNDSGIFSESNSTLGLVARAGHAAPNTGTGVNFVAVGSPVLNDVGQTAFTSFLIGAGVNSTNNSGIFSESNGTLGLVTRAGDAAPGTAAGVNFSDFFNPVFNDAGQTAFFSILSGTGVNFTNDTGIFSESNSTLGLVARAGNAAPDTELGVNFSSFSNPVLNDAGQTAFRAVLAGTGIDGTNDSAIFSEFSGTLGLVARAGDAAPGTAAGVNFSNNGFGLPVLNDAGQTAFLGSLIGTDVNNTNDDGLFATDSNGLLQLIARTGDLFDVNSDPLVVENRTINAIDLLADSGGSDGRATSFNNASQLAFLLRFTDGTQGIFIANVPEPASLTLLGVVSLALLGGRRRPQGS